MNDLKKTILTDIKVEVHDEFDKNFTRKAFFDQPWQKRRYPYRRGTLMAVTNRMRRSYRATLQTSGVSFSSDAPGAALHQKGGRFRVTPQMRRYFWAQYYKRKGDLTQTKTGKISKSQRNLQLDGEAEFFRNMALNKKGVITMPKRQVIGPHPVIDETVDRIAKKRVKEYAEKQLAPILKRKL